MLWCGGTKTGVRGNGPPASSNHYCRVERSLDLGFELFKKTCFFPGPSHYYNVFIKVPECIERHLVPNFVMNQ